MYFNNAALFTYRFEIGGKAEFAVPPSVESLFVQHSMKIKDMAA